MSYLASALLALGLVASVHAAPKKAAPASKKPAKPEVIDIYPPGPQAAFDSARIHKLYLDGDFEEAIQMLEAAVQEKHTFSHSDSVFLCKHLGVMYAAQYDTREKGKYYMHQLLLVEPTARILDMYASDMIYMIFKNVQEEFETTRARADRLDMTTSDPKTPSGKTPPKDPPKVSESHPWVWVGAGTALVAAGAATYFILNQTPDTRHVDAQFPNK